MSTKSNRVEEFRGIVEGVIARQVEEADSKHTSWLDYDKVAKLGGLTFISVGEKDMRPMSFGLSRERLWGVTSERLRYAGRLGQLSIVSGEGKPDSLTRRWSFRSAMQMIDVPTARPLTKLAELNDAISWVRSPHLATDELNRLAILQPEEVEAIEPRLAEIAGDQRKLQDDLRRIAERRHNGQMAEDILEESGWYSE